MVQGNWVEGPLRFFLLFFIPYEWTNCWIRVEDFTFCPLLPFFFALLTWLSFYLSLAWMPADPTVPRLGICLIIFLNLYIYLLLRGNPSRQHSKTLSLGEGVRRKGKIKKHGIVEVKKNWRVLAQPPYSPCGSHGDRPPEEEDNPGSLYHHVNQE